MPKAYVRLYAEIILVVPSETRTRQLAEVDTGVSGIGLEQNKVRIGVSI